MERLQKVMAQCGVASRRKSEELILDGQVKVNGKVCKVLGTCVDEDDIIEVNGKVIGKEKKVYILMNKPRNCVTTVSDDRGRPTVIDKLDGFVKARVYPVGRLDFDTTGALILTNDGALANKLMHPSKEIEKVYIAKVKGLVSEEKLELLRNGIKLEDGMTSPAEVELLNHNEEKRTSVVKITIHEGRNRQVKRMFEAIKYEVVKLTRESIAGISTRGLYEGKYRKLTPEEIKYLKSL